MQYGLIFCLYVSTWRIDLLRCQAVHTVISKLPLKYETWFPSHSVTAQAVSGGFFGFSRGDLAVVEASVLGSHLSTRNMHQAAACLGKQLCFGPHLPVPVWCQMPLVIPRPAGHPRSIRPKPERDLSIHSLFLFKMIKVCSEFIILGTWVVCSGLHWYSTLALPFLHPMGHVLSWLNWWIRGWDSD